MFGRCCWYGLQSGLTYCEQTANWQSPLLRKESSMDSELWLTLSLKHSDWIDSNTSFRFLDCRLWATSNFRPGNYDLVIYIQNMTRVASDIKYQGSAPANSRQVFGQSAIGLIPI